MTKHVDVVAIRTASVTTAPVSAGDYDRVAILQALTDADGGAEELDEAAHRQALVAQTQLIERLIQTPARDQADAAAKVRMLIEHVMPASWRGADENLDWDVAMARRLLLSLAGLDPMADPIK